MQLQIINAPTKEFPKRSFQIIQKLGQGGEGFVYQAKPINWDKQQDVAIKITKLINETDYQFIQSLILDITSKEDDSQLKSYKPTNIIKIYDIFNLNNQTVQIMEIGQDNLFMYMGKNQNLLSDYQKYQICNQIVNAISYIHKRGLIHRDIKGENFILVNGEFKLIDFGLLRDNKRFVSGIQGSSIFQAPEVFDQEEGAQYSQSVDIWALGCVFFEIFNGNELFSSLNLQQSMYQIKNHKKDQSYVNQKIEKLNVNEEMQSLIKKMLHPNKLCRIVIKDVLAKMKQIIGQHSQSNLIKTESNNEQTSKNQNMDKLSIEFQIQLEEQQKKFEKTLDEQQHSNKQLQLKVKSYEDQIQQLKREYESLENKSQIQISENSNLKQQIDRQYQSNQIQFNQQAQLYINQQVQTIVNQYSQQFNQSKQILDNEIANLKIRIQQLQDQNQQLQNKINEYEITQYEKGIQESNKQLEDASLKQNSTLEQKQVNSIEQVEFLDQLIQDQKNEINCIEQNLIKFQSIQQTISPNNLKLNSHIKDLEKLIIEKKITLQNYENFKQEIQQLEQNQMKSTQKQNFDNEQQYLQKNILKTNETHDIKQQQQQQQQSDNLNIIQKQQQSIQSQRIPSMQKINPGYNQLQSNVMFQGYSKIAGQNHLDKN